MLELNPVTTLNQRKINARQDSYSYVSPALARSTISWRRITSKDRGREPAGISSEVSCIRTLCQSANLLSCRSSAHFVLFEQVGFMHIVGYNLF